MADIRFTLPEDQWPAQMERWYGDGKVQFRHPTGEVQQIETEDLQADLDRAREARARADQQFRQRIAELELAIEKMDPAVTPELTKESPEPFEAEIIERMKRL